MEMQTTFLRLPDVMRITGLARATIYEMIDEGRFPRQVRLSTRIAVWVFPEIQEWMAAKIAARDATAARYR